MTEYQIITPSAAMMALPDALSGRETDALYGEAVTLIKRQGDWAEVVLETDGYQAWVETISLGQLPPATHHIIAPRALLTVTPDIKSPALGYLPLGALICAEADHEDQNTLAVIGADGIKGYIPQHHALPLGQYCTDYVSVAETMIGTPYRWGGRDSIGFDCSALVQLSLAAAGQKVMRNSGDQEKTIGTTLDHIDDLRRGDLVFWKGHVGIMADGQRLLHANMHHAMTAIEDLRSALPRLEKAAGPITRLARI